jgi:2-hydroxychromene-2-carboxylate isomerase
MRGALAAQDRGELDAYSTAIFDAMWKDARAMGDDAIVAGVLTTAGLDPAAYTAAAEDPAIKDRLRANTDAAIAAGVFGAPSFLVRDRLFFGQDRMDFVEAALKGEL